MADREDVHLGQRLHRHGVSGNGCLQKNGEGQLRFGCVDVELDWRIEGGSERVEFTFSGFDEGSEMSGRGWAEVQNSRMAGKIFLHMGDESEFVARKAAVTA